MTSHDLVKWAPSRLYRKRDGIGQTPCSYERYLVLCAVIVNCLLPRNLRFMTISSAAYFSSVGLETGRLSLADALGIT